MITKQKYFRYLSYLLSALVFLPVFSNNLPPLVGSYHLYAALWILSLLFFEPMVFTRKSILYFLVFGLFFTIILPQTIWVNVTQWNLSIIRVEFYDMVIPLTILGYYNYAKDYKGLAIFVKLSILFILITGVMTFYSASIDPLYARMMGNWYGDARTNFFKRLGGGDYGYVGALIGIFPLLIYYWRNKRLIEYSRITVLSITIFLFLVVIIMQFFGNILISLIFIVLSLTSAKKIKLTVISFSVFFVILLSIPTTNYAYVLTVTANMFSPTSENYQKLTDMATYVEFGEDSDNKRGATQNRAARYPELLEAFLSKPILGTASIRESSYNQAGGHLHWMNRLTVFGLIGFIMTVLYHRYYLKFQSKQFNENFKVSFLLASFAILSYGLIKTIAGREVWYMYFVIIPGFYYLPLLNKLERTKKIFRKFL